MQPVAKPAEQPPFGFQRKGAKNVKKISKKKKVFKEVEKNKSGLQTAKYDPGFLTPIADTLPRSTAEGQNG